MHDIRFIRDNPEAFDRALQRRGVESQAPRLIKALIAFFVMFIISFFFAKPIYNILTWPYVWVAGPENSKFIYTGLLEYFVVQLKLAMFGAAFISFPVVATQIYKFVAPGLLRRQAIVGSEQRKLPELR